MRDWLADLAGAQYVDAIIWTAAALVLLVVVLAVVKVLRGLNSGTFVAGGRNRKTRLAVMDATAIDSQRRLVLVRRDDVEHLLLIGGPSDLLVEQDIRMVAQRRAAPPDAGRPSLAEAEYGPPPAPQPRPNSQQAPRPSREQPASYQERPPSLPPVERPLRQPDAQARRPAEPQRAPAARAAPAATARPAVPQRAPLATPSLASVSPRAETRPGRPENAARTQSIEETLMNELDISADDAPTAAAGGNQAASLDDEMARLLGELSNPRR